MTARLIRVVSCAFIAALLVAWSTSSFAGEDPTQASSSKAARDDATKAIPYQQLSKESQAKINGVLKDVTVYRRMPRQTIDCEPDLYLYTGRNPELIVNMWAAMGITKMSMDRVTNDTFRVSDGEGTKGTVQILHNSDEMNLIYSEGTYDGPKYPRTVKGKCLLVLRNYYAQDQRGRILISSTLDMFLAIDNLGIEILAKTFSSTVNKAADHNFAETAKFVGNLSATSEKNEEAVVRMVDKLQHVDQTRKAEFATIIRGVNEKMELAVQSYRQQHPQQNAAVQQPQPISIPSTANVAERPGYSSGAIGIPVTRETLPASTITRKPRM